MTTTEMWMWALSLCTGLAVGCLYFAGLWWTVKRKARQDRAVLFFCISFALRAGAALGVFFLISKGHPFRLGMMVLGFVIARYLMVKKYAPNT